LIIIISYLPWIILDSWKSNIFVNYFVRLVLLDSRSQFFTSHAIFNHCAYTQWMDQIIPCKSSPFSIRDVASWGTLPTPHALKPNTYNNYSKANLTKAGFGNGGHCFATCISLSHYCCALARARLVTFWSFYLYTTMAFPKMRAFILAWFWCWGPFSEVERPPRFGLFCHQTMGFLQMLSQQPFGTICNNASANFTLPFQPNLHPFFVLPSQIKWTRGCRWLVNLVDFKFQT
jgi:hypothetical protein